MKIKKILFLSFLISSCATHQTRGSKNSPSMHSEYYQNPNSKFSGTIVFENGSGTNFGEWKENLEFFDCAKQLGSLFLYDRPGLGKSPPDLSLSPQSPITAESVSDKLQDLLKKHNIPSPYLFVAHSYGALYAGLFVLKNPTLVKGVLFVDPVPRNFDFSPQRIQKYEAGVKAAKSKTAKEIYEKYTGSEAEVIYQLLGFKQSKQDLKKFSDIDDSIPVVIISATGMAKEQPIKGDWYENQKQWLNKNSKSKIILVNSDHFVQIRKPQNVCNELKSILN